MEVACEYLDPLEFIGSINPLSAETMPRYVGWALDYRAQEIVDWHYHEVGQILYAVNGGMRLHTPKEVVLLAPTMAAWIPPGTNHRVEAVTNIEMRLAFARPDSLPFDGERCRLLAVSPLARELLLAVVAATASSRRPRDDALHDLFAAELSDAPEIPLSLPLPKDDRLAPMLETAIASPGDILSVTEWVATAHASRKTVERLFRKETGMTPSHWLRQSRLLCAVSALAEGRPIGSIALDLGYSTASSFTYMFRQSLGTAPSDFISSTTNKR